MARRDVLLLLLAFGTILVLAGCRGSLSTVEPDITSTGEQPTEQVLLPTTETPPTDVPPTAIPPTETPPTATNVPPTEIPPTEPPADTLAPSLTPSSTTTATNTPKPTSTPSPEHTATATPLVISSSTPDKTGTVEAENEQAAQIAGYVSGTLTALPTGMPIPTGTPVPTDTPTRTITPSATYTISPTLTPSRTFTITPTIDVQQTLAPTQTALAEVQASAIAASVSGTLTALPTDTLVPTSTPMPTDTPTRTITPSATYTVSPTITPSRTFTITPTIDIRATLAFTQTALAEVQATAIAAGVSGTLTAWPTDTPAPTDTPTRTLTPSATYSPVPTRTIPPSPTPTAISYATHYSSLLAVSFDYPDDWEIPREVSPYSIVTTPAMGREFDLLALTRGRPDDLVREGIMFSTDAQEALEMLVYGYDVIVRPTERFGVPAFEATGAVQEISFHYYLIDYEEEWLFLAGTTDTAYFETFETTIYEQFVSSISITPLPPTPTPTATWTPSPSLTIFPSPTMMQFKVTPTAGPTNTKQPASPTPLPPLPTEALPSPTGPTPDFMATATAIVSEATSAARVTATTSAVPPASTGTVTAWPTGTVTVWPTGTATLVPYAQTATQLWSDMWATASPYVPPSRTPTRYPSPSATYLPTITPTSTRNWPDTATAIVASVTAAAGEREPVTADTLGLTFETPEGWPAPYQRDENSIFLTDRRAQVFIYRGDSAYATEHWSILPGETDPLMAAYAVATAVAGEAAGAVEAYDHPDYAGVRILIESAHGSGALYLFSPAEDDWIIVSASSDTRAFETYLNNTFEPLVQSLTVSTAPPITTATPTRPPLATPLAAPSPIITPVPSLIETPIIELGVTLDTPIGWTFAVNKELDDLPPNAAGIFLYSNPDDTGDFPSSGEAVIMLMRINLGNIDTPDIPNTPPEFLTVLYAVKPEQVTPFDADNFPTGRLELLDKDGPQRVIYGIKLNANDWFVISLVAAPEIDIQLMDTALIHPMLESITITGPGPELSPTLTRTPRPTKTLAPTATPQPSRTPKPTPIALEPYNAEPLGLKLDVPAGWTVEYPEMGDEPGIVGAMFYADKNDVERDVLLDLALAIARIDGTQYETLNETRIDSLESLFIDDFQIPASDITPFTGMDYPAVRAIIEMPEEESSIIVYGVQLGKDDWFAAIVIMPSDMNPLWLEETFLQPLLRSISVTGPIQPGPTAIPAALPTKAPA
ncbi:MAG: hypothetical protein JW966_10295 [Anaerolineae bacterium]|nr:hypothetical protein [Anaerolineae bacterium]